MVVIFRVVAVGGRYFLGCDGCSCVYFGRWCVVVGLFEVVVAGGGYFLGGAGWWWMVVCDYGWWHGL